MSILYGVLLLLCRQLEPTINLHVEWKQSYSNALRKQYTKTINFYFPISVNIPVCFFQGLLLMRNSRKGISPYFPVNVFFNVLEGFNRTRCRIRGPNSLRTIVLDLNTSYPKEFSHMSTIHVAETVVSKVWSCVPSKCDTLCGNLGLGQNDT